VNHLPDSIPIHIKDALTRCSIPDAVLYDYDSERDAHHYILVEVKYCRDTDPAQQRERASQQHQVLRETIQKYICTTGSCRPSYLDARSVGSNLQLNHGSLEREARGHSATAEHPSQKTAPHGSCQFEPHLGSTAGYD
jgi:hypothetical protein